MLTFGLVAFGLMAVLSFFRDLESLGEDYVEEKNSVYLLGFCCFAFYGAVVCAWIKMLHLVYP